MNKDEVFGGETTHTGPDMTDIDGWLDKGLERVVVMIDVLGLLSWTTGGGAEEQRGRGREAENHNELDKLISSGEKAKAKSATTSLDGLQKAGPSSSPSPRAKKATTTALTGIRSWPLIGAFIQQRASDLSKPLSMLNVSMASSR
jgi:hypothetical protein